MRDTSTLTVRLTRAVSYTHLDFVNKFTSRNQVAADTASAADEDETKAREAAGKEMEDILKDSVNKEEN